MVIDMLTVSLGLIAASLIIAGIVFKDELITPDAQHKKIQNNHSTRPHRG